MITFPRLKTFLCVFPISSTVFGLRGGADEVWRLKLTDERAIRAFGALLPYLDGRTSSADILAAVEAAGIHGPAASSVLRQLESASLIEEGDASGLNEEELARHEGQIRFFSRFTQQGGAKYQAALKRSRVGIVADGALGMSLYRRLVAAGVGEIVIVSRQPELARTWVAEQAHDTVTTVWPLATDAPWPQAAGAPPRVLAVCQEAHDPVLLEAVDGLSKQQGLPWLLLRTLDLQEGWIGPLFVPGETASYLSLEARLRTNLPRFPEYVAFDAHVRNTQPPPALGGLSPAYDVLAGMAAIELIKFVTDMKVPEVLGKFLTVNLWTWETELHEVLRVPGLDRPGASQPVVFPWKIRGQDDDGRSPGRV
jgi:bacteriocin biosynthesis cyclodehydratase domain-containing protein